MKKITTTLLFSCFAVFTYAQNSYLEIVRTTIKTEKKALIAEVMELTDEESIPFWETYNEYDEKLYKLNTAYYGVVMEFADNFEKMSAEKATDVLDKAAQHSIDVAKLDKAYAKKMRKVLTPQKTLRFFQAMNKIEAMINAQLAAEIPLLESIE